MKVYTLICCLFILSCDSSDDLKIIPLKFLNEVDTSRGGGNKHPYYKIEYFLIEGNVANVLRTRSIIDSFVNKYIDTNVKTIHQYEMHFLKSSEQLNEKTLRADPTILRYKAYSSEDPTYLVYIWFDGHTPTIIKYKNGSIEK